MDVASALLCDPLFMVLRDMSVILIKRGRRCLLCVCPFLRYALMTTFTRSLVHYFTPFCYFAYISLSASHTLVTASPLCIPKRHLRTSLHSDSPLLFIGLYYISPFLVISAVSSVNRVPRPRTPTITLGSQSQYHTIYYLLHTARHLPSLVTFKDTG